MRFEPWLAQVPGQPACRTCAELAQRFPATSPPDAAADLARARHLLSRLRAGVARGSTGTELQAAVAAVLAQFEAAVPPAPHRDDV